MGDVLVKVLAVASYVIEVGVALFSEKLSVTDVKLNGSVSVGGTSQNEPSSGNTNMENEQQVL